MNISLRCLLPYVAALLLAAPGLASPLAGPVQPQAVHAKPASMPVGARTPLLVPSQYPNIQAAVNASQDGDTVLVADGTYSGPGNRDIDFLGKNITVTSQNGPTRTIIDCGGYASTDGSGNHRGFYIHSGETSATISGFAVKNGYETYISSLSNNGGGGGICIYGSGVTVQNCTISSNTAEGGGGISHSNNGSSATRVVIANCTISGNTARSNFSSRGGGFFNYNGKATVILTNCSILGNTSQTGDADGGGVYNDNDRWNGIGTIALINCNISGNAARYQGGGLYNFYGGDGGDALPTITLTNCTVSGNTAQYYGGVFNANYSYYPDYPAINVTNCIFYGDVGGELTDIKSSIVANSCDVQGGYTGASNINADPQFVNAAAGDLHLKPGSPCLGKGTPNGAPATDLDGNTRPNPPSMGAYESGTAYTSASIHLTADNITGDADGIVCDNLNGMDVSLKDTLTVTLDDPNAVITDASLTNPDRTVTDRHTHPNVGSFILLQKKLVFYPPDEFNFEQQPQGVGTDDTGNDWITKSATRKVTLTVHFTSGSGSYTASKDIILARPPVVLVHGINSDWSAWHPFETNIGNLGIHIPLTTVNHWDALYKGNDPVETGSNKLANTVTNTLYYVRRGQSVPFFDALLNNDFFNDYQNHPLAIKRVDVVGWSYGGMITRWYITPEDSGKSQSVSWYQPLDNALTASAPPYGHDVRKFITLGSMWRGVPLANYVNEVRFPTPNPVKLGKAPLNNLASILNLFLELAGIPLAVPQTIDDLVVDINSQIPVNVPSMEVMAVNSPWLSEMIYHDPFRTQFGPPIPKPFDNNIAYGSVAGDNNAYLGGLFDSYTLLDNATTLFVGDPKSPFPYLRLEYLQGAQRNYSDGVVPLWSSALPGSYKVAPSNHTGYPNDDDTVRYVTQWLNNAALPLGANLNSLWDTNTQVQSYDGNKVWQFAPSAMAPQAEDALYPQINGIGRINPTALQGANTAKPTISFTRTGATAFTNNDLSFQLRVSNSGAPATDFKITNAVFSVIGLTPIPPGYVPLSLGDAVALLGQPQTLTITALKGADTPNLFCKFSYQYDDPGGNLVTSSSPLLRLK